MTHLLDALRWLAAHRQDAVDVVIFVWLGANLLWAEWPMPKSARARRIWRLVHSVLQLVVTHRSEPGTFTLPWLARIALEYDNQHEKRPDGDR
jgi:hypothetical protein